MKLAIIGAGVGGYTAALLAAKKGIEVILFEERELGGTCLNKGCIPTKTLLHSAQTMDSLNHTSGIRGTVTFDMKDVQVHKQQVIEQLQKGIQSLLKQVNITYKEGHVCVIDGHHLEYENTLIEVDKVLIATGSIPFIPSIKGIKSDCVITSDQLLESEVVFDSLIIIGGGVIGMELASLYASLNKKVFVLEAQPQILPTLEKDVVMNLKMILKKKQVEIFESVSIDCIEDNQVSFIYKDQSHQITADRILVATGRSGNTQALFKKNLVAMNKDRIQVNQNYQTSIPDLYAIGDVIEGIQLAHVAAAQATACIQHILQESVTVDVNTIPSCIYTEPEIATVGMTQAEAVEKGIDAKQIKYPMAANGKTILSQQERGFIKLIVNVQDHTLLGAQLMCARASDMIGECALAIVNHLKYEDIIRTIHPHPTFVEAIKDALEQLD